MIVFERGSLLWVFNFHSTKSFADYRVGASIAGKYPYHNMISFNILFSLIDIYFLSYVLKGQSGIHLCNSLTGRHNRICGFLSFCSQLASQNGSTLLISGHVKSLTLFWPNLGAVNTLSYLDGTLWRRIRFVWFRDDYVSSKCEAGLYQTR